MLTVISPAKKLNFEPIEGPFTFPEFQEDAASLAKTARRLSVKQLQDLMSISADLATLNTQRFKSFEAESTPENAKQAAFAFAGDTYTGLEAGSLELDEIDYAQNHLRILSGLYGVLRPRDLMQPYRLEMGSRLATRRGKNLYAYWGARISQSLNRAAAEIDSRYLINCASQEYFGAVDQTALEPKIITPQFLEDRVGGPKVISFSAKKARGAMARHVVQKRVNSPEGLLDFDSGGFVYAADRSTEFSPVFIKPMA